MGRETTLHATEDPEGFSDRRNLAHAFFTGGGGVEGSRRIGAGRPVS
jgi:hypothetical protein